MIWLSAPGQRNEPPFKSHTSLKLDHAVVMLGAGASAGAGVPVMRGFVDRARDYLAQGFFPTDDEKHVRRALNFYESLRRLLINH